MLEQESTDTALPERAAHRDLPNTQLTFRTNQENGTGHDTVDIDNAHPALADRPLENRPRNAVAAAQLGTGLLVSTIGVTLDLDQHVDIVYASLPYHHV